MSRLNELIKMVNHYNDKVTNIGKQIKEKKRTLLKGFLKMTNDERQMVSRSIGTLRNSQKDEKGALGNIQKEINDLCTFNFDELTTFLADIISLREEETYQKLNLVTTVSINIPSVPDINGFQTYFEIPRTVCVITSYKKIEEIKTIQNNLRDISFMDLSMLLGNSKYIVLDKEDNYNIYDANKNSIKTEITDNFKYLIPIFEEITNAMVDYDAANETLLEAYVESQKKSYTDGVSEEKRK